MPRARCLGVLLLGITCAAAGGCREEAGGVQVKSLKFNGVEAVTEKQLETVLATQESAFLPWGTKHYFSREQFEADLKRIEAFYADRGYPGARVKSFDVRLTDDQNAVHITLNIVEGEPLVVEQIQFEGFEPLPDEHAQDLRDRLPLQAGAPLDRALVQASREAALDELRDHGHPYASVKVSETEAGARARVVRFAAEPGPLARFGEVEISGNSSVSDGVVRRQLWFRPGEIYQASKLRESQRRLYGLELFQFVNVEPVGTDERSEQIGTRVTVTEGDHRRVNFSVGYGSEERARAQVDWRHVNFFGGARTAGVLARYSSLDRGVRLNFNQPYVFTPRYSLNLSGQFWHSDEPAFVLDTVGGRVTLTRQFRRTGGPVFGTRPSTTLAVTYANEWEDYAISREALEDLSFRDELIALGLDPRTGTGTGQRSAISIDLGRNTTENLLDARQGYVATLHLEQAGRWLQGSYDYYEVTAEGRYYLTLEGFGVAAVRARGGSIDAFGSREQLVPFFKRYFLGGATNLRGWGRFQVAPLSRSGLPIGGHSFFNFSTELRVPIWGDLGGVLFLDGGNVWESPWDFELGDMRYDVGPGLRYNTPVGPIRVDFGYQLNPIPGLLVNGEPESRRFRFHFSIGHAF